MNTDQVFLSRWDQVAKRFQDIAIELGLCTSAPKRNQLSVVEEFTVGHSFTAHVQKLGRDHPNLQSPLTWVPLEEHQHRSFLQTSPCGKTLCKRIQTPVHASNRALLWWQRPAERLCSQTQPALAGFSTRGQTLGREPFSRDNSLDENRHEDAQHKVTPFMDPVSGWWLSQNGTYQEQHCLH